MTGRTIAIGDIHGCVAALNAVLDRLQPQHNDTIITLGDYVDRGPSSRDVVDCLLALRERCEFIPLVGNHERMLMSAIESRDAGFWLQCGGAETVASYGGDLNSIPESHLEFFQSCALAYETDSHLFVHANYDPNCPIDEQDEYVLLWKHLSFGMPAQHISGKSAVVGHTPQVSGEVLDIGHLICIDTYCFGDGWLTALDVDSKATWQANKEGIVRGESEA